MSSWPSQRAKRWISSSTISCARGTSASREFEVARDDLLEVVDVVQRHPRQLAAAGVDVAGHGDVDQQQRAPRPAIDDLRELLDADDRVGGGGGADDDVGARELLGEPVEPHDRAAEALRESERAVGVAVGDEDRAGALVGERLRGQLARLAGAEDHDVALAQAAEHAGGEVDGDGGHAHAAGADAGLRAHALAGGQRGAEEAVGERPGVPGRERGLVGALDLPLDLGLADDHRLEPGGDPEQLTRGVAVARRVDRLGELGGADRGVVGEQPEHVGLCAHRIPHHEVQLGAVAGGDRDGLAHLGGALGLPANSTAAAAVKASRSRSSTGAVLCEMPSASSSLMRAWTPGGEIDGYRLRLGALSGGFEQLAYLSLHAAQADRHDRDIDQHDHEHHDVGGGHVLAGLVQRQRGHQKPNLPAR